MITLRLKFVVRTLRSVRSSHDERHRVNRTIAEYVGSDGEIYRKSFEQKGSDPVVPEEGTHDTLNKQQKQW